MSESFKMAAAGSCPPQCFQAKTPNRRAGGLSGGEVVVRRSRQTDQVAGLFCLTGPTNIGFAEAQLLVLTVKADGNLSTISID